MSHESYVHGYTPRESVRLSDQANTLAELLHHDTLFDPGTILEAGCGTGAQTILIAPKNPGCRFLSIDQSPDSLKAAQKAVQSRGIANVAFQQADLYKLPFDDGSFDGIFVCFVLEHLADPAAALAELRRVLKPSGRIQCIEGDHGSWYCHPRSEFASHVVDCLTRLQTQMGSDPLIGRRLYPLFVQAGFKEVRISPRMIYVDSSRPDLVVGFSKNTFTAMVEGVRDRAIAAGLTDPARFDRGIADLYRATRDDGTFCYTFFKAFATR
jgi:ubiquinone/menaquinone biosynthesis C-methylase UbiE